MLDALYYFSIISYTLRSLYFIIGSALERSIKVDREGALPFISILVPARNEEKNILRCVESLTALSYPQHLLEIIVVDDRSTDTTGTLLKQLQNRFSQLQVLTIVSDGQKNLQGKAGALDCGIGMSKGEIVLMTDADCIVNPGWAMDHVLAYASPDVGAVCAYTLVEGESFFAKMQAVEWNSTHTMASAAVYFKQFLGCYGNNMSVLRSAYDSVGGYANIPFSVTEDLALLQALGHKNYTARYLCTPESSVTTYALSTMREYIAQHKRWTLGARSLGMRAVVFVLTSAALWAGIFAALLAHDWSWVAIILLVRVVDDFAFNAPALRILNRTHLLIYNVPAVLFFTLLELVLPFLIIDRKTVWKGQTFRA